MTNVPNRSATVLLIDDEEPLLEVLGTALTDAGYGCLQASAALGALKILDRTPEIDVIISDIRMPGMDGIELLRNVRERYHDRNWLQIIFVTGHATLDNSVEALRLAAADFLHKPVQGLEFLESVSKAVAKACELRRETAWRRQGHEHVTRLVEEVQQLGAMLGVPPLEGPASAQSDIPAGSDISVVSSPVPDKDRMIELLRLRDVRTQYFSGKLFIDPAWHMLVELMEHHLADSQVTAFSLYIVSGVPMATASRRLDDMETAGLVCRWTDPDDGRRQLVSLSKEAVALMLSYLTTLDQQINSR